MLAEIFIQNSQTEAAEMDKTAETDRQTETTQTSAIEGISSAPPPVQSIPSCLKGMPSSFIMILQAAWTEAMTRLAILEAKFQNMEGGVKPWVDTQLEKQDRRVQLQLDLFKMKMTQQLGSVQTPDITKVRAKVVEIKRMVMELYDRPIIPKLVVTTVMPDIHIDNIWVVSDPIEET